MPRPITRRLPVRLLLEDPEALRALLLPLFFDRLPVPREPPVELLREPLEPPRPLALIPPRPLPLPLPPLLCFAIMILR